MARASVLVANRFIVNISVKPAKTAEPAVALALQLDLAGVEKLAASH